MNKTSNMLAQVKTWAIAHKILASIIGIAVVFSAYKVWAGPTSASAGAKYILSTVSKGTLVSSVTGSGQVAAANQVTVTSTVTGTVTGVYVSNGQEVKEGEVLASIDDSDAVQAVNNAELALENAKVAYDKSVKDAADQAATSTVSDLAKAYQAGYNAIVATAIDLPSIYSGVNDIYYTPSHSPYFSDVSIATNVNSIAAGYKSQAGTAFDDARKEYDSNFLRYKDISINSSPEEIISLLNETNVVLKKLLGALSSTYSTMDYIQNHLDTVPAQLAADKSEISGFVSKVNSDSTSVSDALNSIDTAQTSGETAGLNMKAAELTVQQDETALTNAQKTLDDHRIKAPFDGLVAKAIVKTGDAAVGGTQIATLVTKQDLVDISLNEVDAAKVENGDKATLTFDAIDGLSLTGHVTNVDLVGTVSQGVVSYTVEISFDAVDPRVKPGMTVNASIITGVKQDVLLVPASAVKTHGGTTYVQVLDKKYDDASAAAGVASPTAPVNVPVSLGASNDSEVEIVSGLAQGDQVVTRTVSGSAKAATTPSILSGLTGNRGAAGGVRINGGGGRGG